MKFNTVGLSVGKAKDISTDMVSSQWLGFTLWVIQSDKMEERELKKRNVVARIRMVHVALSSWAGFGDRLWLQIY